MSTWDTVILKLLRIILQDIEVSPEYDDDQLLDVILASAHLVNSEIDFNYTYTVDLILETIIPDPVDNNDISFINIVAYKSALFILNSELKTASTNGIMIKDGPSIIDTRQFFVSQKTRYDLMLKEYNQVKMAIKLGDLNAGIGILTPFSKNNSPTYIWG